MKIGSLFDGSGTAPLAAAMCGIEPVWASEIEPYPIKVTKKRFPGMKHLGSILDINGAEIEPVDIICGGSPCQDLSVAGKQKGLIEGERSHLFFEMTRIITEMRDATNGKYPRYVIWENVPGAFSSNNGYDFLAVLRAFAQIADPNVYVPRPACKGKTDRLAWQYAGTIMGDGYSIAWRTVDAQHWGVPHRRRRLYLVLDLGGERAGKILFEHKSVSGDSEPSGTQRKEAAGNAGSGAEGSCDIAILNDQGGNIMNTSEGVTGTLRAQEHRHQPIVCYEPKSMLAENWSECDVKNALRAGESKSAHAVVYAIEGDGNERAQILQSKSPCMKTVHPNCVVYPRITGLLMAKGHPGSYTGQDAFNDMLPVVPSEESPRKYIVRRLTPLECCRLQGFPDYWTEGIERYPASDVPMYVDPRGAIEGSDSAKYKMWGNGMALPNMLHVMRGIVRCENEDRS